MIATIQERVANRTTIAARFNTDSLTTHNILQNLSYGFFRHFFGEEADKMWKEAHPFKYPAHDSINFTELDLDFVEKHFELFASNAFTTPDGVWVHNPKTGKCDFTYNNYYRKVTPVFNN